MQRRDRGSSRYEGDVIILIQHPPLSDVVTCWTSGDDKATLFRNLSCAVTCEDWPIEPDR